PIIGSAWLFLRSFSLHFSVISVLAYQLPMVLTICCVNGSFARGAVRSHRKLQYFLVRLVQTVYPRRVPTVVQGCGGCRFAEARSVLYWNLQHGCAKGDKLLDFLNIFNDIVQMKWNVCLGKHLRL